MKLKRFALESQNGNIVLPSSAHFTKDLKNGYKNEDKVITYVDVKC